MAGLYHRAGGTGVSGNNELSEQYRDPAVGVVQSLDPAYAVYQLFLPADPAGALLQLSDAA